MHLLFNIAYGILFFACVAVGGFIAYHFLRYSPSKTSALIGTTLFLSVFIILIFTNAMLFFMLPLDGFFSLDFDLGASTTFPFQTFPR